MARVRSRGPDSQAMADNPLSACLPVVVLDPHHELLPRPAQPVLLLLLLRPLLCSWREGGGVVSGEDEASQQHSMEVSPRAGQPALQPAAGQHVSLESGLEAPGLVPELAGQPHVRVAHTRHRLPHHTDGEEGHSQSASHEGMHI